jgi:hypothetical protein
MENIHPRRRGETLDVLQAPNCRCHILLDDVAHGEVQIRLRQSQGPAPNLLPQPLLSVTSTCMPCADRGYLSGTSPAKSAVT